MTWQWKKHEKHIPATNACILQFQNDTNNTFTSTCVSKANSACTEGVVQNYELGCVCDCDVFCDVEHMQNFKRTRRRSQKIAV